DGSTVNPYTLAVSADGITNTELADDAVGLEHLADGTTSGDLIQWDGSNWVMVAPSTLSISEVDGDITNELQTISKVGSTVTLSD
uniref:hypothetical protein n=1 Tax=uncultured Maribacter sp. TaxID=431308 RepID=UPI002636CB34